MAERARPDVAIGVLRLRAPAAGIAEGRALAQRLAAALAGTDMGRAPRQLGRVALRVTAGGDPAAAAAASIGRALGRRGGGAGNA
jgi:uncharacterized protein (DUF697 family)